MREILKPFPVMFSISSPLSLPFPDFTARGTQFNSPKLTVRPRLLPVRWAFCTECCQRSHQTPRLRERLMTPELMPSVRPGKTRSPRLLPACFGTARSADKRFAEGWRPGRAGWRPLPPPGPPARRTHLLAWPTSPVAVKHYRARALLLQPPGTASRPRLGNGLRRAASTTVGSTETQPHATRTTERRSREAGPECPAPG